MKEAEQIRNTLQEKKGKKYGKEMEGEIIFYDSFFSLTSSIQCDCLCRISLV